MVGRIDCEAATKSIILNAVAYARFANCEFDAALQVVDAILALPPEELTDELALADAIRGMIEVCLGDYEQGRRHLRERIRASACCCRRLPMPLCWSTG